MNKLREILAEMGLAFRLDMAVVEKLEELEGRIKALEENRKMKDQAILSLEKRWSECLLVIKSMKNEHK